MSKTKEILRLRWELGLSVRETSRACGASTGVVSKTESRTKRAGLTWEQVEVLEETERERRLYGGPKFSRAPSRPEPDPSWLHQELRRPGVTLELLHLEYLAEHPDGFRYTALCDRYRTWLGRQAVTMRQVHRAGEKAFVDYSGKKPHFFDPLTGECVEVEIFVAVLGASNYTYAEATLTQRIAELLEHLNARPMKRLGGVSRRDLYERYDQDALLPLPSEPYVVAEWRGARVAPDYHVALDDHYYSVPYVLCSEDVEGRLTPTTVEVFHRGKRVASHARSYEKHRHTTLDEHMPEAHRAVFEAGDAIVEWARGIGPMCEALVRRILESNFHREIGWRSAKGLQRQVHKYGPVRLEAACERALVLGARSYKPVERMLKLGRESIHLPGAEPAESAPIAHENVRGPAYYN